MKKRDRASSAKQVLSGCVPVLQHFSTPALRLFAVLGLAVLCAGLGACSRAVEPPQDGAAKSTAVSVGEGATAPEQASAALTEAPATADETPESAPAAESQETPGEPAAPAAAVESSEAPATTTEAAPPVEATPPMAMKTEDPSPPSTPAAEAASTNVQMIPISMRIDSGHWYGDGWTKRAPVSISAAPESVASNYPVKVTVTYQPGMKADFSDVRFTLENGVTELRYALENVTAGSQATARVVVPSLGAGGHTLLFAYFGNEAATAGADAGVLTGFTPSQEEPEAGMGTVSDREMKFLVVPPPPVGERPAASGPEIPPPPEIRPETGN
jgi:hypothetical protein